MGEKVPTVCRICERPDDDGSCDICGGCANCCSWSDCHCSACLTSLANTGDSLRGCHYCEPTCHMNADEAARWNRRYGVEYEWGRLPPDERGRLIEGRSQLLIKESR